MTYNQILAERVRKVLNNIPGCVEKKMFGGVGFILHGNMICGVQNEDLIVRVGLENNEAALSKTFVRPFMGVPGRPMAGWVLVAQKGVATDGDLQYWIDLGYKYVSTLPKKA